MCFFFFGILFGKLLFGGSDSNKFDDESITDKIALNLLSGDLYFIENGDLYYLKVTSSSEKNKFSFVTHSSCLSNSSSKYHDYACNYYSSMPVKVNEVSYVKRLRVFNKPFDNQDNFAIYAITEDGNIYSLNEAVAKRFLGNNNIEDIVGQNDDSYELLLKNGTYMTYTWTCTSGDCGKNNN